MASPSLNLTGVFTVLTLRETRERDSPGRLGWRGFGPNVGRDFILLLFIRGGALGKLICHLLSG